MVRELLMRGSAYEFPRDTKSCLGKQGHNSRMGSAPSWSLGSEGRFQTPAMAAAAACARVEAASRGKRKGKRGAEARLDDSASHTSSVRVPPELQLAMSVSLSSRLSREHGRASVFSASTSHTGWLPSQGSPENVEPGSYTPMQPIGARSAHSTRPNAPSVCFGSTVRDPVEGKWRAQTPGPCTAAQGDGAKLMAGAGFTLAAAEWRNGRDTKKVIAEASGMKSDLALWTKRLEEASALTDATPGPGAYTTRDGFGSWQQPLSTRTSAVNTVTSREVLHRNDKVKAIPYALGPGQYPTVRLDLEKKRAGSASMGTGPARSLSTGIADKDSRPGHRSERLHTLGGALGNQIDSRFLSNPSPTLGPTPAAGIERQWLTRSRAGVSASNGGIYVEGRIPPPPGQAVPVEAKIAVASW